MELRDLLSSLFSGWETNNAAGAASSPYKGAGLPKMSVGAGQAPTIYDNGGLPADVVQRGRGVMRSQLPQGASGQITPYVESEQPPPQMLQSELSIAPPPAAIAPARLRARAPAYDTQALDNLMMQLSQGPTEGQNANIDDATRQRALVWALRNNPGA